MCFNLGFASTANGDAPGNYALLDQRAALHWIQENIGDFNGDKNQVTLMAHGYGAAMAHLLLISPVLSGFFPFLIFSLNQPQFTRLSFLFYRQESTATRHIAEW